MWDLATRPGVDQAAIVANGGFPHGDLTSQSPRHLLHPPPSSGRPLVVLRARRPQNSMRISLFCAELSFLPGSVVPSNLFWPEGNGYRKRYNTKRGVKVMIDVELDMVMEIEIQKL